jgi:hypothetical protein
MSLVLAYERMIGGRGTEIKPGDPPPVIPDKKPVILHPPVVPEAKPADAQTTETKTGEAAAASAKPAKEPRKKRRKKRKKRSAKDE